MRKPRFHSSKILLQGNFYRVEEDQVVRSDGGSNSYISLRLDADAAVILAQDREGRYILNREYRHPTGEFILGCPGGRLEPGEDPLVGGARELVEESGYEPGQIELIGTSYPFPGLCNQRIYYLWARNCKKVSVQKLDPLEYITTELKTETELKREILSETAIDGLLCTALWYKSLSFIP